MAANPEFELDLDGDSLREECGVFGIFGHDDAAALTALGLHASSPSMASDSIPNVGSALSAITSRTRTRSSACRAA
jgi:hypothetical protein